MISLGPGATVSHHRSRPQRRLRLAGGEVPSVRDEGHPPACDPPTSQYADGNGNRRYCHEWQHQHDSEKVFAPHGSYSRSIMKHVRASRRGKRLARWPLSGYADGVLRRVVRQPQMTVDGLRAHAARGPTQVPKFTANDQPRLGLPQRDNLGWVCDAPSPVPGRRAALLSVTDLGEGPISAA